MEGNPIQLGQARENSTSAVSVVTPPTGHKHKIETIILCNQSGAAATFRIFFDNDGTTYDQTTALYYDADLPADSTLTITFDKGLYLNNGGNLAYRSSVANAITITVFGEEVFNNV